MIATLTSKTHWQDQFAKSADLQPANFAAASLPCDNSAASLEGRPFVVNPCMKEPLSEPNLKLPEVRVQFPSLGRHLFAGTLELKGATSGASSCTTKPHAVRVSYKDATVPMICFQFDLAPRSFREGGNTGRAYRSGPSEPNPML